MILDCSKYVGPCRCGREHTLETKKVVVEYNALDKFDQYMDEVGLSGKRAVIYDTNTYNLPTLRHVRADQEIVLNAEGLHSEKGMIEDMMRQLDHPDVIVAVGSGTIMDFGRYPAYHLGIPFVAVPTLASSDGFTANICSIIIDGQKKSIPMQAAALVVCDLNVVSGAPPVADRERHFGHSGQVHFPRGLEDRAPRLGRVLLPDGRRPRAGGADHHAQGGRRYGGRRQAGL